MTWQWHHQSCQYRVWAMLCQNLVKIWALVQKLWHFLSVMLKIGTYSQRQVALYCVSNLFLCFCEDPVSFPVPSSKKSHCFQLQSTIDEAGCLENPLLWLPPCNIMMGLWCIGTMRHLLAHTLRYVYLKLSLDVITMTLLTHIYITVFN